MRLIKIAIERGRKAIRCYVQGTVDGDPGSCAASLADVLAGRLADVFAGLLPVVGLLIRHFYTYLFRLGFSRITYVPGLW